MALKKPLDLFGKKENSGVFNDLEVSPNIAESYDKFRNNFEKVNELSEKVETLSKELSEKLTRTDLENAMLSQLMVLDENFKSIQSQVKGLNKTDLKEFKERVYNLTEIVENLVEIEIPKYKKKITKNELHVGEQFNQFQEVVEESIINIREEIDTKFDNIADVVDNNIEYFNQQLQETSSQVKKTADTYNNLSKIVENKISKETEKLNEYSKIIENIQETLSGLKTQIFLNEKEFEKIDKYLEEHHQELVELKEEVFSEIEKLSIGNLQENIERLEKKIDYIKETYSQIEPEVIVKEVIKEGLLNEPPETKNQDPLTPLNQNFVTLDQLQDHYRLFINRIQQQLSTLGGGGETQLKYLDDIVGIATNPSAYNNKFLRYNHSIGKFEFVTVSGGGGGGISLTDLSVTVSPAGISTLTYNNSTGVFNYTPPNLTGYATTQSIVGFITSGALSGYATQGYVTNSLVGYATQGYVNNAVVGFITSGASGSNLTGIVTSITAGSGISINQSTGNVTITATGGGGGTQTLDSTLGYGNTSLLGMSVGVVTATSFVGNLTGTATTATTVDVLNTNGLTTVYYPTFVESRTNGQVLRGDVDLTYRTDTNTLTVPNISSAQINVSGIVTASSFRPSSGFIQAADGTNSFYIYGGTGNVAFQGTIGASQINTASGYKAIDFGSTTTPSVNIANSLNVGSGASISGVVTATSFSGSGANLTGIVTFIAAGSGISVNQNTGNVTITNTGASLTGNNTFTGINTFTGSNTFSGSIIIEQVTESFNKYSTTINASSVVNLDCSTGNIHYITSTVGGNWTANLTNIGLSSGYCGNYTLVINQGATAYIPNSLQIAGVTTSINWQGGSLPSGNNNKKDVIAYSIFNDAGAYTVFGQLVTFG